VRITGVETFPITLTLKNPVKMAHITITESHNLLVKVTTDDGIVGWGEGVTAARLTGETQGRIEAAVEYLSRLVMGEDPLARNRLWLRMTSALHENGTAIGAIDIALADIAGKAHGVPVHQLLGGAVRDVVGAITMVGSGNPQADAHEAAEKYSAGYRWFKIKLGLTDQATELETVRAVCEAVPSDAVIGADANEAWQEADAITFISRLDGLPVRFLEQPVPSDQPDALIRIAERVPIAICADQSVHSLHDIIRFGASAVAGVSLKLVKLGGITGVMRGAHLCEALNMHINLAGKVAETSVAAAANVHAAAAMHDFRYGTSPANQGLEADITVDPLLLTGGVYEVPSGPGLGVEVDEGLVESLRSGS